MGKINANISPVYCIQCKVAIHKNKKKFCSLNCKGLWQKLNQSGKNNPNYRGGKTKCVDCKLALSYRYPTNKNKRCRSCWIAYSVGVNSGNWKGGIDFPLCINCNSKTRDYKSILCRKCYRGALSPNWKGGVSNIRSLIRNMPENRQWIKQCMFRDGYECKTCGACSNGKNLQVHHIKQFAQILKDNQIDDLEKARECDELWDNDNGITLCIGCHKLTESFNKKIN